MAQKYRGTRSILDKHGRFNWTDDRTIAAVKTAEGWGKAAIEAEYGISGSTIWHWEQYDEYSKEVDKLSLMYGMASRAYRVRLLNKAIRQKIDESGNIDLDGVSFIDLIKEARMQTEGVRLDILSQIIAAIPAEAGLVDGPGPGGSISLPEKGSEETDRHLGTAAEADDAAESVWTE